MQCLYKQSPAVVFLCVSRSCLECIQRILQQMDLYESSRTVSLVPMAGFRMMQRIYQHPKYQADGSWEPFTFTPLIHRRQYFEIVTVEMGATNVAITHALQTGFAIMSTLSVVFPSASSPLF